MALKFMWKIKVPCCFRPSKNHCSKPRIEDSKQVSLRRLALSDLSNPDSRLSMSDISSALVFGTNLHIFTLKELQVITHGFSKNNFLGEGGFGPVYKGFVDGNLRPGLEAQPVAVKKLDLDGTQGDREWLAEVVFLGELKHPHLVNLIGYCCEEEHRLLVYEFMERGNLEGQLFGRLTATLPWSTRLKIVVGAAKGLAFLHQGENPVIYRDFKASNILLDADFNAKVSDFGLATSDPEGDDTHVTTRIMGTKGYAAPEYIMTGHLTAMSDVYSFGVVLLELLTGRRSVDKKYYNREQVNLVNWARPMLKDHHKLDRLMDSNLEGQYSTQGAKRAALVAYQCLSNNPKSRPSMSDVVKTLEPLIDLSYDIPIGPFVYIVPPEGSGQDEGAEGEEKEGVKKEKRRRRRGNRVRYGSKSLRDGTVHSDTDLYDILGDSLHCPVNLGASLYCPVDLVVKQDRIVLQK